MESLIAAWAASHLQKLLADAIKKYITVGRLLKKIASSFILFQICIMGIQLGLTLAIVPWFAYHSSPAGVIWLSVFGAVLGIVCLAGLIIWNSEKFWIHRLKIDASMKALKNIQSQNFSSSR
jgi:hypothetical protein